LLYVYSLYIYRYNETNVLFMMAVKKNRNFTCMDDRQLPGHFSFCRIYLQSYLHRS